MGNNLGLGLAEDKLGYATQNESILGYLAHGLAEWHHGDALLGAHELSFFKQHLRDVKSTSIATSLDWVSSYLPLVDVLDKPITLALNLRQPTTPHNLAEGKKSLEDIRQAKTLLESSAGLTAMLKQWEGRLKQELSQLFQKQRESEMSSEHALRQRELGQWTEIMATLPNLIDGYDYSRVHDMLQGMRFDSPEIQSALEGQIYLHGKAQAFLTGLFADIKLEGYQGKITRQLGSSMDGRIIAANSETVIISLDRGNITLPVNELTPQTLLNAAQFYADKTTDSTEFYERQERIAAFARVAGLPSLSAAVAAQLMEENRSFRSRWMKVQ
jgi:hypothetical protein